MKILIAEDEKNLRIVLRNELASDGCDVLEAESGLKALELLEGEEIDVLLLDLNMPGMGGMEVLKKAKRLELPAEVIILTANATVSTAVEAMKLGAYDYLTKPFRLEELSPVLEKAYEKKSLRAENFMLKTQMKRQCESHPIIAGSPAMKDLLETSRRVAQSDFPVLITGESGCGKELVARAVHKASGKSDGPFIAINCGAIPENMIESELFGYEKGAFTGAHARKLGLLEIANNGSLFLDEIGDMPLPLQVKLLRVIETGSFFRLGGTRELTVNVRIISATNKDLGAEVAKGGFRQDLFYRITPLSLSVPPLRERKEEIPLMIELFKSCNPAFKDKVFSGEAVTMLSEYSWPGNVRELQNVVHRTLLLSKSDKVGCGDLPMDIVAGGKTAGDRLEDVERNHILKVLKEAGGQKGKAAEVLDIDPKTLYRKLQSYGIKG